MNSADTDTREDKPCIPEILDIDLVLKVVDVGAAPWLNMINSQILISRKNTWPIWAQSLPDRASLIENGMLYSRARFLNSECDRGPTPLFG